MSDEQSFEDYYAQAVFTEDKATARAAYQAGWENAEERFGKRHGTRHPECLWCLTEPGGATIHALTPQEGQG